MYSLPSLATLFLFCNKWSLLANMPTRLWPSELSHGLPPTARIDGFDLSAAQYPPRNWLPANVHLHVQNSFAPFPPEHIGTYDIVHMRLFFTLLNSTNVEKLTQNLFTLLSMSSIPRDTSCLHLYITRIYSSILFSAARTRWISPMA